MQVPQVAKYDPVLHIVTEAILLQDQQGEGGCQWFRVRLFFKQDKHVSVKAVSFFT